MSKVYILYNPVNKKWLSTIRGNTFYWTQKRTKAKLFEDEKEVNFIAAMNLLDIEEIEYEN